MEGANRGELSVDELREENRRLRKELSLVTEQREILKKPPPFWDNEAIGKIQADQHAPDKGACGISVMRTVRCLPEWLFCITCTP